MNFNFYHFNFNVLDLDKSLKFYEKALKLQEDKRVVAEDGSFILVYLTDKNKHFDLELTWIRDRTDKYNLGENEFHLAFKTEDFDEAYKFHKENDWIVFDNPEMGIYFISDPDGYWIEILPPHM